MRFFGLSGVLKGRANASAPANVQKSDVEDAQRLADALRAMQSRLSALESRIGPEGSEFEVETPSSGTFVINHGYKGSVRWYVTNWFGSTAGPQLQLSSAGDGYLTLESTIGGLAVIRVEPSQYGLTLPKESLESIYGPAMAINGLRLTLTSGTPVTTSDVSSAATVYLTPHIHGCIALWDGYDWVPRVTEEVSKSLSGLSTSTNHDVYAYWTGSAVALEFVAWAGSTTPPTRDRQNGILVKNDDPTRRYVGSFRTTSGTPTTDDSASRRWLFNHYHRLPRPMRSLPTPDSWSYTSAAWRGANGGGIFVSYLDGTGDGLLRSVAYGGAQSTSTNVIFSIGIGIDDVLNSSAQLMGASTLTANVAIRTTAHYTGYPGAGYHEVIMLEYGGTGITFLGDSGAPSRAQTGIIAEII